MNSTFYESLRVVKKETEKTTTTKIKRIMNKKPGATSRPTGNLHTKNCHSSDLYNNYQTSKNLNKSEISHPKSKEVLSVREDVSALSANIYYPRLDFLNKNAKQQSEQFEVRKYIPNLKSKNGSGVKSVGGAIGLRSESENPLKKRKKSKKKRAKSKRSPENSPGKLPFLIINEEDLQKILKKYDNSDEQRSPERSNWMNVIKNFTTYLCSIKGVIYKTTYFKLK